MCSFDTSPIEIAQTVRMKARTVKVRVQIPAPANSSPADLVGWIYLRGTVYHDAYKAEFGVELSDRHPTQSAALGWGSDPQNSRGAAQHPKASGPLAVHSLPISIGNRKVQLFFCTCWTVRL